MTGRRSSRMADALAAASGVSSSVLWGNISSMVYDAMTKPGGFTEAVGCIDPSVAAPVIAVATGLGIVKRLKGKSSRADLQKLYDACKAIEAQNQDITDTLRDIVEGVSPLSVELDELTKRDLAEFFEERWSAPGSTFRQTLAEEVGQVLADHPSVADILGRLDLFGRKLERQGGEATAAPPAPRSNFSQIGVHWNRFYTGRDDDLIRLREAMATSSQAIAHAIDGEGGIGKTEIARAYAFLFGDEYDGVWWLDASGAGYTKALEDLFELLNDAPPPDGTPPEAVEGAVRTAFADGAHLLVLDNVEDLDRFDAWRLGGSSRVLATTRLRHPTHAGIRSFEVGVLSEAAATDLLCKLVEGRKAPPPREELAAIARELGGHALAVSVAGAYLAHYPDATPAEVLERLCANPFDEAITTEDGKPRDPMALKYEHDVRVSLSLHFDRFEKSESGGSELDVLRILACCHPEGIPVPLIAAAAGLDIAELRPLLQRLAGVSIIRYDGTISLHRLTQAAALASATDEQRSGAIEALLGQLAEPFINAEEHKRVDVLDGLVPHAVALAERIGSDGDVAELGGRFANDLGMYLSDTARINDALRALHESERISRAAFGDAHPIVAIHINNIGAVLKVQGDLAGALKAFRESEQIDRAAFGDEHPSVARDVNNIGSVLMVRGDLNGALKAFRESERIDRAAYGDDHPDVARDVNNIGRVFKDRGDLAGALKAYRESERIDRVAYGDEHPSVAIRVNNIGNVLLAYGDLDGALKAFCESEQINRAALGDEHPSVARNMNNIGVVLHACGDLAGALKAIGEAFLIILNAFGPQGEDVADSALNLMRAGGDPLALAREHLGDRLGAEGLETLRRAIVEEQRRQGNEPPPLDDGDGSGPFPIR